MRGRKIRTDKVYILDWKEIGAAPAPDSGKAVLWWRTTKGAELALVLDPDTAAQVAEGLIASVLALGFSCEPIAAAIH